MLFFVNKGVFMVHIRTCVLNFILLCSVPDCVHPPQDVDGYCQKKIAIDE